MVLGAAIVGTLLVILRLRRWHKPNTAAQETVVLGINDYDLMQKSASAYLTGNREVRLMLGLYKTS
jgi:hypothetical protein